MVIRSLFLGGRENQLLKPRDPIQNTPNLNNKSPGYCRDGLRAPIKYDNNIALIQNKPFSVIENTLECP